VAMFSLDRSGRILEATDFAMALADGNFALTVGGSVHEIPGCDSEPTLASFFRRSLRSKMGAYCKGSFALRTNTGGARYYEAQGKRCPRSEGAPAAVICFHEITAHFEMRKRLERSGGQLRSLSARLQRIREEERKRLSRIVHDELGQTLLLLEMGIAALKGQVLQAPESALRTAEQAAEHVKFLFHRVRRIASELRPAILDEFGLAAAIEWQGREFESSTGISCEVDVCQGPLRISNSMQVTFFRILQEALTNTLRHACASHVWIRLAVHGGRLELEVRDNGRGMRAPECSNSGAMGLLGMRERAASMGGKCEILGAPGGGVSVIIKSPRLSGAQTSRRPHASPWK
jgi:signal transduction histidine kinase